MDYYNDCGESENSENDIEHFNQQKVKNACHFACSSINYTNIIVLIITIILIYHFIITNFFK
jgi:hypothetical protein